MSREEVGALMDRSAPDGRKERDTRTREFMLDVITHEELLPNLIEMSRDRGRVIAFLAVSFNLLLVCAGGAWWFSRGRKILHRVLIGSGFGAGFLLLNAALLWMLYGGYLMPLLRLVWGRVFT